MTYLIHLAQQLADADDRAGLVGLIQAGSGREDAGEAVAIAGAHLREQLRPWRQELIRVQDAHARLVAAIAPTDPRAILDAANEVGTVPRDDGTTDHLSPAEVADLLAEEPARIA